jgi:hypothetical protein
MVSVQTSWDRVHQSCGPVAGDPWWTTEAAMELARARARRGYTKNGGEVSVVLTEVFGSRCSGKGRPAMRRNKRWRRQVEMRRSETRSENGAVGCCCARGAFYRSVGRVEELGGRRAAVEFNSTSFSNEMGEESMRCRASAGEEKVVGWHIDSITRARKRAMDSDERCGSTRGGSGDGPVVLEMGERLG